MSKSNTFENDFLALIFNATPIANLADNAAASPLTNLYLALHTADPGEAGTQATNEVAYPGYARVAVQRTPAGWVVTNNSVSPAAAVEFGEMTAGTPGTATHLSVGVASAGAGKILYSGAITPVVNYNIGVVPRLRTTSTITED
jgi:hypothetical protein